MPQNKVQNQCWQVSKPREHYYYYDSLAFSGTGIKCSLCFSPTHIVIVEVPMFLLKFIVNYRSAGHYGVKYQTFVFIILLGLQYVSQVLFFCKASFEQSCVTCASFEQSRVTSESSEQTRVTCESFKQSRVALV